MNPEKYKASRKKHHIKLVTGTDPEMRERHLQRKRRNELGYKSRLKTETLIFYGPNRKLRCSWSGCDAIDIDVLTLDHIENDGGVERAKYPDRQGGCATYQMLRKRGYPPGYQTLCANHQLKKEVLRRKEKWLNRL